MDTRCLFCELAAIIVGLLFAPWLRAETIGILIQSSPLAGSQYYAVEQLRSLIKPGDRLTLTREANNRHDRNAVRVDWNGQKLGYVPRAQNRVVARAWTPGKNSKHVLPRYATILIRGSKSSLRSLP